MGFRYLVLGTHMGRPIAHCLAEQRDTSSILIGDINIEAARRVVAEVSGRFPAVACGYVNFDANDPNALKKMPPVNVVISALPARYNLFLAEAAIRRKENFCDLGGVLPVSLAMKSMDESARSKGVSVVPDCGLMPGLGVMIARKLVEESVKDEDRDVKREVVIYVGGLPQKPQPPIYHQNMFSFEGLRHLCYDDAVIIKDGMIQTVAPLSGYEIFRVDELTQFSDHFNGVVEAFITSGAGLAPWGFQGLGVTSLYEKTVRWPGFVRFIRNTSQESFEEKISPLIDTPVDAEHPDLVWMKVEVEYGMKKLASGMLVTYDEALGMSAMEQTTGFTTALTARAIALGMALPGVLSPDEALTGDSLNRVIAEVGNYFLITQE